MSPTLSERLQTIDEINRELSAQQTHCYTCGKLLGDVRWECPTCRELQCSEACRTKHIADMDSI
jgi:lipopolysaccharide biosynthesis regulator YciM